MMTKGRKMTLAEIDEIEERFREVFATKEDLIQFKSDLFDKLEVVEKKLDITPAV